MFQFQKLCQLPPANPSNLASLRRLLFKGPEREVSFLEGTEYRTWDEKNEGDLTSLNDHNKNRDVLSKWLYTLVGNVYHRLIGQDLHGRLRFKGDWQPQYTSPLTDYPDRYFVRVVDIVSTILAPLLPTVSALGLFLLSNNTVRMGLVFLFSFLFSLTLALLGVPRRIDAFAATAAFTAVLIVFVSNNTDYEGSPARLMDERESTAGTSVPARSAKESSSEGDEYYDASNMRDTNSGSYIR